MLTKKIVIGSREVLSDGQIQVREDTVIEEDGVELSRTYRRYVVYPGESTSPMPVEVQRVAAVEHTPEVIAAYEAEQLRLNPPRP